MNILCVPDPHCWYVGPGPEDARITEFQDCAHELIEIAAAEHCEVSLFPGDLFDVSRPEPWMIIAAIKLLKTLKNPYIIDGNHEATRKNSPNFISVIGELKDGCVTSEPRSFYYGDAAIVCIPFFKDITDEQLIAITRAEVAKVHGTKRIIVMAHYATDISLYSSGELALGNEPVYRMADLEALPVDLVCLGHIHNPKILNDKKPIILHTGALTRRDHGEAKDDKLAYVVNLDSGKITSHLLPARRFTTINPLEDEDWSICKDAYVRFKFKTTAEEYAKCDPQSWIKRAKENGAFFITGTQPVIERPERVRVKELSEKSAPIDWFRVWIDQQDVSEETKHLFLERAEGYLGEVAA